MTYDDVINNLKCCLLKAGFGKDALEQYLSATDAPRAVEYAAMLLWFHEIPEDEDTAILREQLKHLRKNGMFKFEE